MAPPKKNRLADTIRNKPERKIVPTTVAETLHDASEPQLNRRTTIYLSNETWKAAKVAAAEEETNVSQIVEKLLKDYLNSR